jgi:Protein of unknown function (DUF4038)/Putative collagen-binding domain of a collagenase
MRMNCAISQKHGNLRLLAAFVVLTVLGPGWVTAQVSDGPLKVSGTSSFAYPLKVSANGRYLVDQNNIPFLIVGDAPQPLPVMISPSDAARYFDDREAHGFNSMWINVLCASPYFPYCRDDGSTYDGIRPFTGYIPGGTDTAHYDLTKPNEAYFARVDQMLTLAKNHGMVVFLDPIETGQWLSTLRNNGVAAAHAYGEYLGNRYQRFRNIIWFNGNDFGSWQDPRNDAVVRAVAEGIKSMDPKQLQTLELLPPAGSSFDDQTWVSIVSLNGTYVYGPTYIQMSHSYDQRPVAPTYLIEAHYDLERVGDDYGTPSVLRRQEYWTMLTGGKGQLYGNAYTWTFMPGWKFNLDTVGVSQLMIWHQFFSSLPWQNLVPDQAHTVVTAGLGTYGNLHTRTSESDFCTAARASDGSLAIAYMPTAREITVNMASLKGPASAEWFDPTNGTYTTISGGPFANTGTRQFAPPGKNGDGDSDWVLLLKASLAMRGD